MNPSTIKYAILLTITATLSTALAQGTNAKRPFIKGNGLDCAHRAPNEERCWGTKDWCDIPDLRKIDGFKTFKECFDAHEPDRNKSTPKFPNNATSSEKRAIIQKLCSTNQFIFFVGNKYDVPEKECTLKLFDCINEQKKDRNPELNVIVECLDNKFS